MGGIKPYPKKPHFQNIIIGKKFLKKKLYFFWKTHQKWYKKDLCYKKFKPKGVNVF